MRRRPRARALVAAVGAALALGALPAPAQASVESMHCLHPPITAGQVIYCGCVAVATVGMTIDPDSQWACAKP